MSAVHQASKNLVAAMRKAVASQPIFSSPSEPIRLDSTTVTKGKPVKVDFGLAGAPEINGLHAHVRGMLLCCKATFTTSGVTNGALSADDCRASVFQNLSLVDSAGHHNFEALDPRFIIADTFIRTGSRMGIAGGQHGVQAAKGQVTITDEGIPLNVGAAQDNSVDASVYIPFASPRPRGSKHNPFHGLISLAALQARGDAFTFKMGPATPIGAPANLTFKQIDNYEGNGGLDVLLDIVWLPALHVPAAWALSAYQDKQTSNTLLFPDESHEYIVVRNLSEDSLGGTGTYVGLEGPASLDNVSLTVGGKPVFSGQSRMDLLLRERFRASLDWLSAFARQNAAQSLPIDDDGSPAKLHILTLVPYVGIDHAAAGPVQIKVGSRDATFTSYLHRHFKASSADRIAAHARAAGVDAGAITPLDANGNAAAPGKSDGRHGVIIAKAA